MKKQLQGISLILFGILLNTANDTLNSTILRQFSDFPYVLFGMCFGIAGLILVFIKGKNE